MNEMNGRGIPDPEHSRLRLWTIYDGPADYPSNFVARLSLIGAGGAQPTEHLMVSTDLAAIRAQMMAWGLHCIARYPEDEPHIVEVWL
ncbi:hypothetical protein BRDID11004_60500 [Bradyrhizobium diazoefficiens]|uniref:Uncharacterized protein n=1 Tax=Bradyrhizobium diazoefficiens TaxID=1355477 RepID=A0A810AQM5_9BRAD|nr:hypothetical protein [Bradyrhizobium diazoefficiens]BBZ93052.1 hypothetical protein F07S3_28850 [Bradyrhizobium diazoefficiens]BCA10802.1 hypothetical protein BDHF08_26490 [Bradyrhizobium diazoefficiens]BCE55138.1 hypothetical protein XF5B_26500 [Bradyrhizobium diazoefficiens]BCE63871.1 hypothetical protein XF6B_26700 [Bradyrhizobium diazoefficiens]